MKQFDGRSSGEIPAASLQILGELKLPIGSDVEPLIHSWLLETLQPLSLGADFLSRISKSAREAVARATTPESAALDSGHIHLLVFAPREDGSDQKTWGFFRVDKLDGAAGIKNLPDHSIEFYLYVEGT